MNKKTFFFLFIMVILASAGFWYFKYSADLPSNIINTNKDLTDNSQPVIVDGTYTNNTYGFTLHLPDNVTANSFAEGEGETILIQSKTNTPNNTQFSMQMYITSFHEDIDLTISRTKKDVPDLKMENATEVLVGDATACPVANSCSATGVAFFSNDNDAKYREIWFVHTGYLYQILAPAVSDEATSKVMKSWKWI